MWGTYFLMNVFSCSYQMLDFAQKAGKVESRAKFLFFTFVKSSRVKE